MPGHHSRRCSGNKHPLLTCVWFLPLAVCSCRVMACGATSLTPWTAVILCFSLFTLTHKHTTWMHNTVCVHSVYIYSDKSWGNLKCWIYGYIRNQLFYIIYLILFYLPWLLFSISLAGFHSTVGGCPGVVVNTPACQLEQQDEQRTHELEM